MQKITIWLSTLALPVLLTAGAPPAVTAQAIVAKLIDGDPWGMGGAELTAHVTLKDKGGMTQSLAFSARSRKHDAPFAKSMVRFTAPADLAGAGFLQIQNRDGDDDRYLFLPELKRARRISGNLRRNSFMGTDFSFADMDRRDLREGTATLINEAEVGKFPCYHLNIVPSRSDSPYSHFEVWVRKDNYLVLKMELFDRANVRLKSFNTLEVKRVEGHWYITKSQMIDNVHSHSTNLVIDNIVPRSDIADEDFTVRQLEKL
jgi:hypothetical protein